MLTKKNNFFPLFVLIVCYVWSTHACMTKLYCKLLRPTHKKQKPQVFCLYYQYIVGASCAYSNDGLCVL